MSILRWPNFRFRWDPSADAEESVEKTSQEAAKKTNHKADSKKTCFFSITDLFFVLFVSQKPWVFNTCSFKRSNIENASFIFSYLFTNKCSFLVVTRRVRPWMAVMGPSYRRFFFFFKKNFWSSTSQESKKISRHGKVCFYMFLTFCLNFLYVSNIYFT